jgi:glycosyltransferase involved in cell wall biosynthesis
MRAMDGPATDDRWLVLQEGDRRRWGGDLRRAFIFAPLAERTGATVGTAWTASAVRAAARRADAGRRPWTRRPRPRLATAELLPLEVLGELGRLARPFALDVHDDPLAQREVLGLPPLTTGDPLERRWRGNVERFAWLVAPSASFAALAGLDPARTIVVPNGTDTRHVRPAPLPAVPTIGLVSGAAPGRGVEALVEAARLLHGERPELRLRLWLAAAGDHGAAWLAGLADACAADPWIEIGAAPYEMLGDALATASVLVVPHPAGAYFDAAVPVKLFDGMAAGRPVVVTPRTETRVVVEAAGAGVVAAGDGPEDLAAALRPVLDDPALAARLGAAARRAAETRYDWRVLGDGLADRLLGESEG